MNKIYLLVKRNYEDVDIKCYCTSRDEAFKRAIVLNTNFEGDMWCVEEIEENIDSIDDIKLSYFHTFTFYIDTNSIGFYTVTPFSSIDPPKSEINTRFNNYVTLSVITDSYSEGNALDKLRPMLDKLHSLYLNFYDYKKAILAFQEFTNIPFDTYSLKALEGAKIY